MPRGVKTPTPTRADAVKKTIGYLQELTNETDEYVYKAITISLKLVYQLWVCELLRMGVKMEEIAKESKVDRVSIGRWRDADYTATFEHAELLCNFYTRKKREIQ